MDDLVIDDLREEFVDLVHRRTEFLIEILTAEQPTREMQYEALLVLHNLKGAGGSLGFRHVAEFCHGLEDMLTGDGFDFLARRSGLIGRISRLPELVEAEYSGDEAKLEAMPKLLRDPVSHLSFLIYASNRVEDVSFDLDQLLRDARRRNEEDRITGILLFSGYRFVQVLEGARHAINQTFSRIARDGRHENVQLLCLEEITERRFGDWSMAYVPDNGNTRERITSLTGQDRFTPHDYPARILLSLVQSLHDMR